MSTSVHKSGVGEGSELSHLSPNLDLGIKDHGFQDYNRRVSMMVSRCAVKVCG